MTRSPSPADVEMLVYLHELHLRLHGLQSSAEADRPTWRRRLETIAELIRSRLPASKLPARSIRMIRGTLESTDGVLAAA